MLTNQNFRLEAGFESMTYCVSRENKSDCNNLATSHLTYGWPRCVSNVSKLRRACQTCLTLSFGGLSSSRSYHLSCFYLRNCLDCNTWYGATVFACLFASKGFLCLSLSLTVSLMSVCLSVCQPNVCCLSVCRYLYFSSNTLARMS